MNTVSGVIFGAIGFIGTVVTMLTIFIEVDGKKKVKLSPSKMMLLISCICMICIGFYSLFQIPITDTTPVELTPEPSEITTTPTLNIPDSTPSESIPPDILNLFIY